MEKVFRLRQKSSRDKIIILGNLLNVKPEDVKMSKEYRQKIRGIDEEGKKGINALIEYHKKKAAKAAKYGDKVSEKIHNDTITNLKNRLTTRENVSTEILPA